VHGQADQRFDTRQLPELPDIVAPDGSDVRVLLRPGTCLSIPAGTHFQFPPMPPPDASPGNAVLPGGLPEPVWTPTVVQVHAERWWACNQGRGRDRYGGR
jgi:hypothetical protein